MQKKLPAQRILRETGSFLNVRAGLSTDVSDRGLLYQTQFIRIDNGIYPADSAILNL